MYPYIHITLPSYGVLAFIGGFFAMVFLFFRLEKYNVEFVAFLKLFVISVVGGVLGSKLLFAITQIPWLIEHFSLQNLILLIPQSGYVYYGGLFGVLFALYFVTKNDLEKRDNVFRLIVPAIPLFHAFGRIGCFMAGCCYGIELDNPINIGIFEFTRFPVQIIEALFEFIMFILFSVLAYKKAKIYSLANYLLMYAVFRFLIEFKRGDEVRGIWAGGLSTAQYVSLIIVAIILIKKVKLYHSLKDNAYSRA